MKKVVIGLFVIAMLQLAQTARAAEDQYPIAGAGTASCGKWLQVRETKDRTMDNVLVTWVQGFLSGMNAQRLLITNQDMILLPDAPTLLAYVDKYCRENPLKNPYAASLTLYQELQRK